MNKLFNLSQYAVRMMRQLRHELDQAGDPGKVLVLSGDGSFRNRTCLRALRDRTEWVVRARKDAALYAPAPQPSRHGCPN